MASPTRAAPDSGERQVPQFRCIPRILLPFRRMQVLRSQLELRMVRQR